MARKPKPPGERFIYDLRAKVPKAIFDAVNAEAAARLVDRSQIVREAVLEYFERRRTRGPTLSQEVNADRIADEVAEEVRQSGTSAEAD